MLKSIPFYSVYIEEGVFYHIGTTLELLNLLTIPIQSEVATNYQYSEYQKNKLISLSQRYQLQNHVNSKFTNYPKCNLTSHIDEYNYNISKITLDWKTSHFVSMNSYIILTAASSIGSNTVFENSLIYGDCFIGSNSIISYVNGTLGYNINIPSKTMFQQISIHSFPRLGYVLLAFDINDNIKAEYNSTGSYLF